MGETYKCSECGTKCGTAAFVKPSFKCQKCGYIYCEKCVTGGKTTFFAVRSGECKRCGGKVKKMSHT